MDMVYLNIPMVLDMKVCFSTKSKINFYCYKYKECFDWSIDIQLTHFLSGDVNNYQLCNT